MSVTEDAGVRGVVLACGGFSAGFAEAGDVRVVPVPARPGKADVDPLLGESDWFVVAGTDADLAAVVLRLLRKEQLHGVSVGFVPSSPRSAFAEIWGLPTDPADALELALHGDVDPVPLIRNDSGGVLVGRGRIGPVDGVAYCDEKVALRGAAKVIEVEPDGSGGPGLTVRVVRGALFKMPLFKMPLFKHTETFSTRAFQLGADPVQPESDGVVFPRAVEKWTWYRHTEDLRLVRR
ncbi:MAG: hypothetical protein JWQ81_2358 [Amycolatopsis sp.]|jgi:hypothetical protein|uniref:hypothetical protein n=1 Tax=Amycolatopsis sp. TaxID=37632 RepID=UPI0026189A7B|nr:hypothetical protein [Amycolatopsis sp.]MCU1681619.1 hypothetical protein [Amycolatopsis sp.]